MTIRTVEIKPPSRSGESFAVAMTAAAIAVCALYAILLRTAPDAGESAAANLPFQISFQELPAAEQRIVRALLEGFGEAKRLRAQSGAWPAPEKLAADGIPPFAPDAIDKQGYRWTLRQDRLVINYLGAAPGSTDYLLLIQEPEPVGAETAQPGVVDEEHQLLPDGKLLHVTYWKRPAGPPPAAVVVSPALERWTQIRIGATEPTK